MFLKIAPRRVQGDNGRWAIASQRWSALTMLTTYAGACRTSILPEVRAQSSWSGATHGDASSLIGK